MATALNEQTPGGENTILASISVNLLPVATVNLTSALPSATTGPDTDTDALAPFASE